MNKSRLMFLLPAFILIFGLLCSCQRVKPDNDVIVSQVRSAETDHIQKTFEDHFIECSQAYQTESGVSTAAWGNTADDKLRQLIIKCSNSHYWDSFSALMKSISGTLINRSSAEKDDLFYKVLLIVQILLNQE